MIGNILIIRLNVQNPKTAPLLRASPTCSSVSLRGVVQAYVITLYRSQQAVSPLPHVLEQINEIDISLLILLLEGKQIGIFPKTLKYFWTQTELFNIIYYLLFLFASLSLSVLMVCHPPQIYLVSGFTDIYSYRPPQLRNDMDVACEVCSPAMLENWWVLSESLLGVDLLLSSPRKGSPWGRVKWRVLLMNSQWLPNAKMTDFMFL